MKFKCREICAYWNEEKEKEIRRGEKRYNRPLTPIIPH